MAEHSQSRWKNTRTILGAGVFFGGSTKKMPLFSGAF